MTRRYSNHNPLRAPDRPAPRPAADISWQGNPPQMTSSSRWALRSANNSPSAGLSARKVVTSSHTGRLGKRAWRMLAWKSSISTAHTGVMPWRISARSPPPPPAKRCTEYFGFSTFSSFLERWARCGGQPQWRAVVNRTAPRRFTTAFRRGRWTDSSRRPPPSSQPRRGWR